MTTPYEMVRQLLINISNDRRRTASNYSNITPNPGSSQTPQRLINDIGFLRSTQFNYYNCPRSHFTSNLQDDRREITKIIIKPYGLTLDKNTIINRQRVENLGEYVIPRDNTLIKNSQLFAQINDRRRGPAYHFIINKTGDITVGPSLDYEVVVSGNTEENAVSVSVAMESGLSILQTRYNTRNYTEFLETSFTENQLFQLSVLIAKLRTIYPTIGYEYQFDFAGATKTNFVNNNEIDDLIVGQGNFDAATEIFIVPQSRPISTGRAVARTAIAQVDTMGALSPIMGNYVDIAAPERSSDIAFTQRRQIFVERVRTSHREAEIAAQGAQTASAAAQLSGDNTEVPAINTGPQTYDFETGLWGDGKSY